MAKKVLAFDLDGTLAPSKSLVHDRIISVFNELLEYYHLCVISGGKYEQFQKQLISNLQASPDRLAKLHVLPTCGTRAYVYDLADADWKLVYAEDFTEAEKKQIIDALNEGVDTLGYREKTLYGETIEDRESQITFSALGQNVVAELGEAGVDLKKKWDPSGHKKKEIRDYVAEKIPQFEVRVGGGTSIDVTKPGIDKAYGMRKLMAMLEIGKEDILFFGDMLQEGGNDYPVKAMGIDSLEVSRWEDTALVLEGILHVTK